MNFKKLRCAFVGHRFNIGDPPLSFFDNKGMRVCLRSIMSCPHCDAVKIVTSWFDFDECTVEDRSVIHVEPRPVRLVTIDVGIGGSVKTAAACFNYKGIFFSLAGPVHMLNAGEDLPYSFHYIAPLEK